MATEKVGVQFRQPTIEGTTKPRGGYRCTVYRHGIPLSGEKDDITFYFY